MNVKNINGEKFTAAEYKEGDPTPKGLPDGTNIEPGVIVLTDVKGNARLCHPRVFAAEYAEE